MKKFLFALLICSFFISSCSKEDESPAVVIDCTNGIQDGDETGIDCGGSCSPCIVEYNTFVQGTFGELALDLESSVDNYESNPNYFQYGCLLEFRCNLLKYEGDDQVSDVDRLYFTFNNLSLPVDCDLQDSWQQIFEAGESALKPDGPVDPFVEIRWQDSSNTYWSSLSADQSESKFTVNNIQKVSPGIDGTPLFLEGAATINLRNSSGEVRSAEFDFALKMFY